MKFHYKKGIIHFFFSHSEIKKAYFFLQSAIDRQGEKGNIISILSLEEILEQTDGIKKEIPLMFEEEFKEFGIDFITAMIEHHKEEGSNHSYLDMFLSQINTQSRPKGVTLQ